MNVEDFQKNGGIIGWINENRGKIGLGAGFGIGYLVREKLPAYLDSLAEKAARKNAQYLVQALKELGVTLPPAAPPQPTLDPEKIYRGLESILKEQENIKARLDALESKKNNE
jgi:DNA topoisomerase VI subunit B